MISLYICFKFNVKINHRNAILANQVIIISLPQTDHVLLFTTLKVQYMFINSPLLFSPQDCVGINGAILYCESV